MCAAVTTNIASCLYLFFALHRVYVRKKTQCKEYLGNFYYVILTILLHSAHDLEDDVFSS